MVCNLEVETRCESVLHICQTEYVIDNCMAIFRLAYRGGVTAGVTAPSGSFVRGSSTAFSLGAPNVLGNGSIQSDVAVHVVITKNSAQSVSTQIAALRAMLFGKGSDPMLSRVRDVGCLVLCMTFG